MGEVYRYLMSVLWLLNRLGRETDDKMVRSRGVAPPLDTFSGCCLSYWATTAKMEVPRGVAPSPIHPYQGCAVLARHWNHTTVDSVTVPVDHGPESQNGGSGGYRAHMRITPTGYDPGPLLVEARFQRVFADRA